MTPAQDHYKVLGVSPTAGRDEIRQAHRRLAHVLHPDRQATASAGEQRLAERRMREINAAWTVLSDPDRRREYDRGRAAADASATRVRATPTAPASTTAGTAVRRTPEHADDIEVHRLAAPFLRRGPLVAILVVAVVIFVFTAYAGSKGDNGRQEVGPGWCVQLVEGSRGQIVDCALANDGEIVSTTRDPVSCPQRYAQVGSEYYCIRSPG